MAESYAYLLNISLTAPQPPIENGPYPSSPLHCICAEQSYRYAQPHIVQIQRNHCARYHWVGPNANPADAELARATLGDLSPFPKRAHELVRSMIFPLLLTPDGYQLAWRTDRVNDALGDVQTPLRIYVDRVRSVRGTHTKINSDGTSSVLVVYGDAPTTSARDVTFFWCKRCDVFLRGSDGCPNPRHYYGQDEGEWHFEARSWVGAVDGQIGSVVLSICGNGHGWRGNGPVRCPKCGNRRRSQRYEVEPLFIPSPSHRPSEFAML
jgi:hypothetical protein